MSVRLQDNQAEILDDVSPLIAARLSVLLATPIVPKVTLWKLKEPQQVVVDMSPFRPLESFATKIPTGEAVAPYVSRGEEPVSLVVQFIFPFTGGKLSSTTLFPG
ncbi:hypothetical protein EDC04DRAFT_2891621 [Pisolithus marmoratus]|nr:hypothetical protein EDC04DRAFT_2891621 [Pisolithus marmoratus]